MKILKKVYIRQSPFPKERLFAIKMAHVLEEKYNDIKIEADYLVIPDFLSDAKTEHDGTDLDEHWIQSKLNKLQYHICHVDMTRAEWKELGLRSTLYGQSQVVKTKFGKQAISYGRWDKQIGSTHVIKLPDFLKPMHPLTLGVWHEDCHSLSNLLGVTDLTHFYFYGMDEDKRWVNTPRPDIAWRLLPFSRLDNLNLRIKMQIANLLTLVLDLKRQLFSMKKNTLLHPIEEFKEYISQDYGKADPVYSLTGHHIGCDYVTPENTPVRAPSDGTVTVSGYTDILGYFCHFQYIKGGEIFTDRYLHLKSSPSKGHYSRGNIVARTGNTGLSTGAHLHLDIWENDVDLTIINKNNWRELTRDPKTHYGN